MNYFPKVKEHEELGQRPSRDSKQAERYNGFCVVLLNILTENTCDSVVGYSSEWTCVETTDYF